MNSSVEKSDFGIDQPVAAAVRVIVEELDLGVDVLIDRTAALNSNQSVSAQLRSMFLDCRRILKVLDRLIIVLVLEGKERFLNLFNTYVMA